MSICFIITSLKNYIGLGITSSSIVKNFRESSVYLCKVLNNYKCDFEKLIMSFEILTTESVLMNVNVGTTWNSLGMQNLRVHPRTTVSESEFYLMRSPGDLCALCKGVLWTA